MDHLVVFMIVGFIAQFIDGSLGMAYKVTSNTFLLSLGIPPAITSATVHTAGVFTSASSGFAHWKLGNVNMSIFKQLLIPGIIGGVIGVIILTKLPADFIKPIVAFYLLLMGLRILRKAFNQKSATEHLPRLFPLALVGGFLDAVGGGGWGPVVTSTLVANGHQPRFVVGSVNFAEFFVTLVQTVTFFILLQEVQTTALVGLIIGGVIAAPVAAYMSKRVSAKKLMIFIGVVIILLSLRTFLLAITG